jgi:phosphatidylserine decarboxylase
MRLFKLPVAREGWPFIVGPAVIAAGLALLGRRKAALPFVAASLASLGFFRDPDRLAPDVAHAVLSPADGRVTGVDEAVDPFVGPSVRVSIFLSPLDVHVNRAPIAGMVVDTAYTRGRFLAAFDPQAGDGGADRRHRGAAHRVPGGRRRQAARRRALRPHPVRLAHRLLHAARDGHQSRGG